MHKNNHTHGAADALDWDEAISLIARLKEDNRWRDAMLLASGCFLGLRISDLLHLKWKDLDCDRPLVIVEKKTGKKRRMKINPTLNAIAEQAMDALDVRDADTLIFTSQMSGWRCPMTRQRAFQILKEIAEKYHIKSAQNVSTHTLRKTFGRRVWLQECEKGRGEQALVLLCDVFGHSSPKITKRYLGIRQDEILSVYDTLA